jgi:hypothetical protein
MQRENESYSNRRNEDKSEEQSRMADEALRRGQGDFPAVGAGATRQTEVVKDRAAVRTMDATLSNGSGPAVHHVGRDDMPMTSDLQRVAGLSTSNVNSTTTEPVTFGVRMAETPLCVESHSGKAMSSRDLFGGGSK